jgi:hypothetical protein
MHAIDDMSVSESVLINVFDMLVKRIDVMTDLVTKLNSFMINETRGKTDNYTIAPNFIFNYPFEIQNVKFDRCMYGYVHMKLKTDAMSLHDIWWSLWEKDYNTNGLTQTQLAVREKLYSFVLSHFSAELYAKVCNGLHQYKETDDESLLTCQYYGIDTLHDQLSEYVLNEFMTKGEQIKEFKSFNHSDIFININCAYEQNSLYIDELIQTILSQLSSYGYKPNDFIYVKVVGLDFDMSQLVDVCRFDVSYDSADLKTMRREKACKYINTLCSCAKRRLRLCMMDLVTNGKDTSILFSNFEDIFFLLDKLGHVGLS